MGRAGPLRAGSAGVRVCPRGWWVLHTRAHRVLVGTAESCGTATPVTTTIPLPCAQTTLTAHRSPTTTHHAHQRNPQSQQKTAPAPQRPRSPMCNKGTHTRSTPPPRPTPRSVHFRREIGPIQPGQPDVEARTTSSRAKATCHTSKPSTNSRPAAARPISTRNRTDLGAELDRSRCGFRPISTRKWTDLGAELDRSRCGFRPISTRKWTDLGAEPDRSRRGVRPISARRGRDVRGSRGGVD